MSGSRVRRKEQEAMRDGSWNPDLVIGTAEQRMAAEEVIRRDYPQRTPSRRNRTLFGSRSVLATIFPW